MAKKIPQLQWIEWLAIGFLVLGVLAQLVLVFFAGDERITNEWNKLVGSMISTGTYSFQSTTDEWYPSAYMPPLYPVFLYGIIKLLQPGIVEIDNVSRLTMLVILLVQVIVWDVGVYIVYKITYEVRPSRASALWSAAVFMFFPLSLVMPSQISAPNAYMLPFLLLMYLGLRGISRLRQNSRILSVQDRLQTESAK